MPNPHNNGFTKSMKLTFTQKRVYHRVTIPTTTKPLLAEAPYPYHHLFRSLNLEKGLYLSCN